MRLIIREYLAGLRERDELDALLPDLLTELGLQVFSRPGRGTRQDGVDVAAVGSLEGGPESVYLFSIKAGDLGRRDWDGDAIQSLRPSLNEILDGYLHNRLPQEHRGKAVVICITVGGSILEQVRPALEGFKKTNTRPELAFEDWDGDRLAKLIEARFLREDLLPVQAQSMLRKSLSLVDEPAVSYQHFADLLKALAMQGAASDKTLVPSLRQIHLCVGILFSRARGADNLEAAYRCSELALLTAWDLSKGRMRGKGKVNRTVQGTFIATAELFQRIALDFLERNVLPHTKVEHGLSSAVHSSASLDVNLKLFDLLGRTGLSGLFLLWQAGLAREGEEALRVLLLEKAGELADAVMSMIDTNPALLCPIRDDQVIDVTIALLLVSRFDGTRPWMADWLGATVRMARNAYRLHLAYPCTLRSYGALLDHPQGNDAYRRKVTEGSVLYPMLALWAALLGEEGTYAEIAAFKREDLDHCTFQIPYPDAATEACLYAGDPDHGTTLTDIPVDQPMPVLLDRIFAECDHLPHFDALSANAAGWWPLILMACRHHRYPVPLQFLQPLRAEAEQGAGEREGT